MISLTWKEISFVEEKRVSQRLEILFSCFLPEGGITVDFLTLLVRLEGLERVLGRVLESALGLCS